MCTVAAASGAASVRVWEMTSRGSRPGTGDRRRMALMSTILFILVLRWRRTTYPGAPRVTGRTLRAGRLRRQRSR
jgi:hypothetical protein